MNKVKANGLIHSLFWILQNVYTFIVILNKNLLEMYRNLSNRPIIYYNIINPLKTVDFLGTLWYYYYVALFMGWGNYTHDSDF